MVSLHQSDKLFDTVHRCIIVFYKSMSVETTTSLLRHLHSDLVLDALLASDSLGVCIRLWGADCRCLDHDSIRRVDGLSIRTSAACVKVLLDFMCFLGTERLPCSGLCD